MSIYIYRYQSFKDGVATTHCYYTHDDRFYEVLQSEGSCTRYAKRIPSNTTRVKPRNVLICPEALWPKRRAPDPDGFVTPFHHRELTASIEQLLSCIASIPWSVDFRIVDLNDYPEYFI